MLNMVSVVGGCSLLPRAIPTHLCEDAEEAFLKLIRGVPQWILAQTAEGRGLKNETPEGWTRKTQPDRKQYIHYSRWWASLNKIQLLAQEHLLLALFIQKAEALLVASEHIAYEVVCHFADQYPHAGFLEHFFEEGEMPGLVMRFLAYDSASELTGRVLATPHTDKSGFTLNLFESTTGLEVREGGAYIPLTRMQSGDALLSYGELVRQLTRDAVRPTDHQVCDHCGKDRVPGIARTSIILFVDQRPGSLPIPDSKQTHAVA